MNKSVENFLFQSLFQLTKILIPMITIPIVSRVLGANGIGIYNYTASIVQYVVIFSGLGITLYGNREIAQNRSNIKKKSEIFIDLFFLKLILTLLLSIGYYFFIQDSIYFSFFLVQIFTILSVAADISWFFMGIEDFKKTSVINLLFQLISLLLIITFVDSREKLLLYILIQSLCLFLSQIGPWMFVRNELVFVPPNYKRIKKHFFIALPYFVPQVAVLLYSNLNKTILGTFSTKENVAFYANSQTINSIIITFVTTIDTVLLPKMSNLSKKNRKSEMLSIMNKSIIIQLSLSIPSFFGVLAITPEFVPWFFGNEFQKLIVYLPIMSCLIVIIPLGMSISRQYLLPIGSIKQYNYSVICGAVINILINLILIKKLGIYAVIISTISAEFMVTFIRVKRFKESENFEFDIKQIINIIIASVLMFICIRGVTDLFSLGHTLLTSVIQVIVGGGIYLIIAILLKLDIISFFMITKKRK